MVQNTRSSTLRRGHFTSVHTFAFLVERVEGAEALRSLEMPHIFKKPVIVLLPEQDWTK